MRLDRLFGQSDGHWLISVGAADLSTVDGNRNSNCCVSLRRRRGWQPLGRREPSGKAPQWRAGRPGPWSAARAARIAGRALMTVGQRLARLLLSLADTYGELVSRDCADMI